MHVRDVLTHLWCWWSLTGNTFYRIFRRSSCRTQTEHQHQQWGGTEYIYSRTGLYVETDEFPSGIILGVSVTKMTGLLSVFIQSSSYHQQSLFTPLVCTLDVKADRNSVWLPVSLHFERIRARWQRILQSESEVYKANQPKLRCCHYCISITFNIYFIMMSSNKKHVYQQFEYKFVVVGPLWGFLCSGTLQLSSTGWT